MLKRNIVVLDLDGTLLDTLQDLMNSVNYALAQSCRPIRTLAEIRSFVGNGVRLLVERAIGETLPEDAFQEIFQCFKQHYMKHCLDFTEPYDGIVPMLGRLRQMGCELAIVSNKLQPAVTELCERFFADFIDVAVGESETVRRKPSPDSVFFAINQLGASASQVVYVGDSEVDLQTARNAGVPCISVLWGFRDKAFLQENGATIFAESPADLPRLLESDLMTWE